VFGQCRLVIVVVLAIVIENSLKAEDDDE